MHSVSYWSDVTVVKRLESNISSIPFLTKILFDQMMISSCLVINQMLIWKLYRAISLKTTILNLTRKSRRGRDSMVVGLTTSCVISEYHH